MIGRRTDRTGVDIMMATLGILLATAPWAYGFEDAHAAWSAAVLGTAVALVTAVPLGWGRTRDAGVLALSIVCLAIPGLMGLRASANVAGMHVFVGLGVTALAGLQFAVRALEPGLLGEAAETTAGALPRSRRARRLLRVPRARSRLGIRPLRVPAWMRSPSTRPSREAPQGASG